MLSLLVAAAAAAAAVGVPLASASSFCDFDGVYPPQYVAYKTDTPPVMDGKLDDPVWQAAGFTADFVDISTQVTPRFRTRAKMVWDDSHLYVAAELEEPQPWANISCGHNQAVIFHDNDFEVFVNADGTTWFYKEWEMNAVNATWDLCLDRPYLNAGYENSTRVFGKAGWDEKAVSVVHVNGVLNDPSATSTSWTVEIAYRLSDLAYNNTGITLPPTSGTYWRINFSRVEWHVTIVGDHYEKVPNVAEDNWVWAPTGVIDIHLPEKWGYLQFATGAVNGTAAVKDPQWTVRTVAMQLYYAQVAYHTTHGEYTDSLTALAPLAPLGAAAIDGACSTPPVIKFTNGTAAYVATMASIDGRFEASVTDLRRLVVKDHGL